MSKLFKISGIFMFALICFLACNKKKSTGITPTYGTTGNPNPNNVTVTGSTPYSNPATENTSINVSGSGWSNPTCGSTNSVSLKAVKGDIDVTITFATAAKTGTYSIASNAGPNACAMTIVNAPGQPAGTVWYGKRGVVTINQTTASINASFTSVVCTQKTFDFPVVSASGAIGCSQ